MILTGVSINSHLFYIKKSTILIMGAKCVPVVTVPLHLAGGTYQKIYSNISVTRYV